MGGHSELEPMDSADPPLGVNRLYDHRHRQLHRPRARERNASAVDHLFAVAAAGAAPVQRPVFVRAAIPRQAQLKDENMKKSDASQDQSASKLIDGRIANQHSKSAELVGRLWSFEL